MRAIFLEKAEITSLNENEEVIFPEDSPDEHDSTSEKPEDPSLDHV
jgi:hypothetical protein